MAHTAMTKPYIPRMYNAKRWDPAEISGYHITAWEKKLFAPKPKVALKPELYPAVCFSRQIGSGALEIADLLGKQIESRVADKLIIEKMASDADLKKETIDFFDERYPGRLAELGALLFGEKSYIMSDYMRGLTSVIYLLAASQPTIFVGRGAHLLLPRERVLAVRVISSPQFRARRIARIMKIEQAEAERNIKELDKAQADFFRKLAGVKEPAAKTFDLTINCDFITDPSWAAEVVATTFRSKFGTKLS